VPGSSSQLWEAIRGAIDSITTIKTRIAAIDRVLTSIPALLAPPDVTTREGHARLTGTLTKGSLGTPTSCDANPWRQLENGSWELDTSITIKIYDVGFLVMASLSSGADIRWKAFGRKRYYDGGGCP